MFTPKLLTCLLLVAASLAAQTPSPEPDILIEVVDLSGAAVAGVPVLIAAPLNPYAGFIRDDRRFDDRHELISTATSDEWGQVKLSSAELKQRAASEIMWRQGPRYSEGRPPHRLGDSRPSSDLRRDRVRGRPSQGEPLRLRLVMPHTGSLAVQVDLPEERDGSRFVVEARFPGEDGEATLRLPVTEGFVRFPRIIDGAAPKLRLIDEENRFRPSDSVSLPSIAAREFRRLRLEAGSPYPEIRGRLVAEDLSPLRSFPITWMASADSSFHESGHLRSDAEGRFSIVLRQPMRGGTRGSIKIFAGEPVFGRIVLLPPPAEQARINLVAWPLADGPQNLGSLRDTPRARGPRWSRPR